MYKYIIEKAGDFDWMAIVSMLIFTTIFVIVLLRVIFAKKDFIDKMARMPLDENDSLEKKITGHEL
ncbi:MAG TPA: CcoQ/FixQ family Cbb3-type cytochrome c oxidase assembly chaperone [Phaeodactylibacter sp.]|nr:CcoQ/FixQ family Cbb3-type cytochrome c oxidase assembly chaperone [Phaeodactylibacter sp.]